MHCQHFSVCGGCSLPGVPYTDQLRQKRDRLRHLLGRDVPALLPSPREDRYRHKVAFVFGSDRSGREIVMGHYAAGSRRIVPIEECPAHSDRGNQLAFSLRDQLVRAQVPPDLLRHLLIRTTGDGRQASVMLVVTENHKALRAPIRSFLSLANPPDGFFVNINSRPGPLMVGPKTIRIAGRDHVREDGIGSASYLISPTAFFQTNIGAARELVRLVMDGVSGATRVLDLYSGTGLFTVPIALTGAFVTAVEESAEAEEDATLNLRLNRIDPRRVRLIRACTEQALERLTRERFDVVVIDPPRQGAEPMVLPAVVHDIQPERVAYVSCIDAPAADLPMMEAAGYRTRLVQPVDMFPHTEHIETVVLLSRDRVS